MDKINSLISLLGEDNEKRLRDSITDTLIDTVKDDISELDHEYYILTPDDIVDFIASCQKEAFERVREEVVHNMMRKIKLSVGGDV